MLRKLKYLIPALLIICASLYAVDVRLENNPAAEAWEKEALDGDADAMYNLARTYQTEIKDFEKAIYWYEKAYEKEPSNDIANNLGYLYDDLGDYQKAVKYYKWAAENGHALSALNLGILCKDRLHDYNKAKEWYEKAYNLGEIGGANNLGYLCEHTTQDDICAERWYKKASAKNDKQAIGNLAKFYRKKGDNVKAGAYAIALIDNGFTKEKIFGYLDKWKLSKEQIKQAYELQKTLDIPKHYTGGID